MKTTHTCSRTDPEKNFPPLNNQPPNFYFLNLFLEQVSARLSLAILLVHKKYSYRVFIDYNTSKFATHQNQNGIPKFCLFLTSTGSFPKNKNFISWLQNFNINVIKHSKWYEFTEEHRQEMFWVEQEGDICPGPPMN